ncbi:hypothetical protein IV203_007018 [Nitzschia inconspicua]|uniref:Uncharacterized protein n=1 Tax=Nitzschia inconspicua TaxID=303405 RepID=A0A9K3KET4_9STRA|nr:hypothetical protein IV203_007018 [Nitzschia inconspicua]
MFSRKQSKDRHRQDGDFFRDTSTKESPLSSNLLSRNNHKNVQCISDHNANESEDESLLLPGSQDNGESSCGEPEEDCSTTVQRRSSVNQKKSTGSDPCNHSFQPTIVEKSKTSIATPVTIPRVEEKKESSIHIHSNTGTNHLHHSASSGPVVTDQEDTNVDGSDGSSKSSFVWDDSSLLDFQSLSDSEIEQDEVDVELKGIQRLEQKLELRRQRLRKLCAGRRSSFIRLVEANDAAAGEITRNLHKKRQSDPDIGGTSKGSRKNYLKTAPQEELPSPEPKSSSSDKEGPSLPLRLWWNVLFECHLTLPAYFTILVVLLGHTTFYCMLDELMNFIYRNFLDDVVTLNQFYISQILLGLSLIRVNGNVFFWLAPNDYNLVRFEMQNRLTLGSLDARFLKHIKGTVSSSALNMFGYYLGSVGVYHFYDQGQLAVMKAFEAWYMKVFFEAGGTLDPASGLDIKPLCQELVDVVSSSKILSQLIDYSCNDSTMEWRLIVTVYHAICLAITALVAARLGQNLLTFCD